MEYDRYDKEVETEIFIHSINEKKIMLETNSDVFFDDVIKLFMREYNDMDKQMEGSGFSFTFVASLRDCLYEVTHLTKVGLLTRVRYILHQVNMSKTSHLREILFFPVSLHSYL